MKNECGIVRDLIPLYVEDMTSEPSAMLVEKHTAECPDCKAFLDESRGGEVAVKHRSISALRSLCVGVFLKSLLAAAAVFLFMLGVILPYEMYIPKAICAVAAAAAAVVFYHELGGKSKFGALLLSFLVNLTLAAQQMNVLYSKPLPDAPAYEEAERLMLAEGGKLAFTAVIAIAVSAAITLLLIMLRKKTAGRLPALKAEDKHRLNSGLYFTAAAAAFVGEALLVIFSPEEYAMLLQLALCLAVGVFVGLYRVENGAKSPAASAIISFIASILPTALVFTLEAVIFSGYAEFSLFIVIDICLIAVYAAVSAAISAAITKKAALAESGGEP